MVYVSYFELLSDRCFDLLNDRKEVMLRDDGSGDVKVAGLTESAATSAAAAMAVSSTSSARAAH